MTLRVVSLKQYPRTASGLRYIGRGSAMGNPFTHLPLSSTQALVQCDTVQSAVGCFESWARGNPTWDAVVPPFKRIALLDAIRNLSGTELLGCYCVEPAQCHGQVIVKLWEELHHGRLPKGSRRRCLEKGKA